MIAQKKWGFGLGTIFSLIVVYFIFLYSRDKGWGLLAFASKWYLIIVGGMIAFSLAIILLVLLISLVIIVTASIRLYLYRKRHGKKSKDYVDIEYTVKE